MRRADRLGSDHKYLALLAMFHRHMLNELATHKGSHWTALNMALMPGLFQLPRKLVATIDKAH